MLYIMKRKVVVLVLNPNTVVLSLEAYEKLTTAQRELDRGGVLLTKEQIQEMFHFSPAYGDPSEIMCVVKIDDAKMLDKLAYGVGKDVVWNKIDTITYAVGRLPEEEDVDEQQC